MCQNPKDVGWHTMRRKDVEELHGFHLEAEVAVNEQEDVVGDLGDVNHAREGVVAFEEGEAAALAGYDGYRALDRRERVFAVALDQRFDQSGFPNSRRTDDGDNDWRCFLGKTVHLVEKRLALVFMAGMVGCCRTIGTWSRFSRTCSAH